MTLRFPTLSPLILLLSTRLTSGLIRLFGQMTLPSLSHLIKPRALSCAAVAAMPLFLGGWFNWLTGPQSTFDTHGPVAKSQLDVFYVTLWVTGITFVIVAAIMAYAMLKFRARKTDDPKAAIPHQGHGNPLIELSLIGLSVLALVFIAVPTLKAIWYTYDVPADQKETAYEVTATGLQWWFKFEYPKEQIDGAGNLVTANELIIPAGRPVRVNLRTADVIHAFWVPKLAGKVDMMPNRGNHLWLQADQPGYFWGQCAEYCGESHAVMRFRVIALNETDFAAWLAHQKSAARTVAADAKLDGPVAAPYEFSNPGRNAPGYSKEFDSAPFVAWQNQQKIEAGEDPVLIAQGRKLFQEKSCAGCHTVRGHEGVGTTAPDLTHLGARTTVAAGLLENTKANLHRWIAHPNEVKPGNKMYVGVPTGPSIMTGYLEIDKATGATVKEHITVNDAEARALVAYLHSLK
ncbi:cytochrome c oxidase subunit II [Rariglobus hedericola]